MGAASAAAVYAYVSGRPPALLFDLLASVAGLGIAVGRASCLLVGDDFGRVTRVPWGLRFPPGTPAYQAHLLAGLIPPDAATSLPVHPLQLYLMLQGLVVLATCTYAWHRWQTVPYRTVCIFLLGNGLSRLPAESFRDAAAGGPQNGLSVSQIMCAASVLMGACLLLGSERVLSRRRTRNGERPA